MSNDLNANIAKCIQEAQNIGHTTYYNICDGTSHVVPWGSVNWLSAIAAGLGIVFAMMIILIFIAMMTFMILDLL